MINRSSKEFYEAANNTIRNIEELLAEYNPLHIISAVSKMNLPNNPAPHSERHIGLRSLNQRGAIAHLYQIACHKGLMGYCERIHLCDHN